MSSAEHYFRNDNEHRVYFNDGKSFVRAGGVFVGTKDDVGRPNVVELDESEYDDALAAERSAVAEGDASAASRGVRDLARAAAIAGTAGERGDLPHTRDALHQQASEAVSTQSVPGSALRDALDQVKDSPDIDALVSPVQQGPASDDGLDELLKPELQKLADKHDVEYTSRTTNPELVDKLRADGAQASELDEE